MMVNKTATRILFFFLVIKSTSCLSFLYNLCYVHISYVRSLLNKYKVVSEKKNEIKSEIWQCYDANNTTILRLSGV